MTADIPQPSIDANSACLIERPDGVYWRNAEGYEYGPFATLIEAEADMESAGSSENGGAATEPLEEAESEIGMADWIDPETGQPAEESVPRIEDH